MRKVIATGLALTAVIAYAEIAWNPAPPTSPGTQSFWVGASSDDDDEDDEATVELYKNGAYLASDTWSGSSVWVQVYTSAGVHTTFEAWGNGVLSAVVNPDTQAPTVPANLAASNQASTSFTLSWSASTDNYGISTYEVAKDGSSLGTGSASTRNLSTGLQPLVQYLFKVRAQDLAGNWGSWSTDLAVTLPDTTAPTAPASVSLSAHTASSVSLSWSAGNDNIAVTAYDVYRTTNGVATLVGTTTASTYSFIDMFVRASTSYTYAVRARDAAGNSSAASSSVPVTTDAAPDQDGDGIPDELEAVFGIQGNSTPPQTSSLNVKVHRPQ